MSDSSLAGPNPAKMMRITANRRKFEGKTAWFVGIEMGDMDGECVA